MTDETFSKPKRDIPDQRAAWQGYAALVVALAVCVGVLFCFHETAGFPSFARGDLPIFYPLILLTRAVFARTMFWGITAVTLIGLLLFAHRRRVSCLFTVLMSLAGLIALSYALFIMLFVAEITPRNTVSLEGREYHLLLQSQTGGNPFKSYIVLECDSFRVICHYFASPYGINGRLEGCERLNAFDETGLLFIDEHNHTLNLRLGDKVIGVYHRFDQP